MADLSADTEFSGRHHALPQKRYFCFSRTIIVIPLFPAAHGVAFFVHSSPQLGSVSYTQIPPGDL
ncbi:hypothetical protein ACUCLS_004809 [Escherichia coli]